MGGIVGRLFREFAVTLSVAIAVSAVVSLTLTPMMCSRLLRSAARASSTAGSTALSERAFDGLLRGYDRALALGARHRALMLVVTLATIGLTVLPVHRRAQGPVPAAGHRACSSASPRRRRTSRSRRCASGRRRSTRSCRPIPTWTTWSSFIGGGGGATATPARMFVELKPLGGAQGRRPTRSSRGCAASSRRCPGIKLFLQAAQDVRVGGRLRARSTSTRCRTPTSTSSTPGRRACSPSCATLPELRDVASDQQTAGLAARRRDRPRHRRAPRHPPAGHRRHALRRLRPAPGRDHLSPQLNQYRVVLEVKPELQQSPDALEQPLRPLRDRRAGAARRAFARFVAVADRRCRSTTRASSRRSRSRSTWRPASRWARRSRPSTRAEREIGLPASVHADFQGTAQAFRRRSRAQPLLILAALLAVYIVLGMLYESYIHPITILSTLPSAGVGALLALLLFQHRAQHHRAHRDHPAHRHREEERDHDDRLRDRGRARRGTRRRTRRSTQACLLRFRPIMMTTLAALLGGAAAGARARHRLGAAPPARHRHRRRPARLAAADAVHHAGRLSLPRPAAHVPGPPTRPAGAQTPLGVRP